MQIIPVIDLKDGIAVHARLGQRESYQPVSSLLCPDSDPAAVLESFLTLYAFPTIYIADLNSITGQGHQDEVIAHLLTTYPKVTFWIDRGFPEESSSITCQSNVVPVLGSESLSRVQLEQLAQIDRTFVLSLDFSGYGALGPDVLFDQAKWWPENIIVMTLAKVGSDSGPDYPRLRYYKNRYPGKNFIAAGGIRNRFDLERLKACGVKQALIASALHANVINRRDITSVAN